MLNINTPGKSDDLFVGHAKRDRFLPNSIAVSYHHCAVFEGITGRPTPKRPPVSIVEQIIAPGHADQRAKTTQGDQESATLQWPRLN